MKIVIKKEDVDYFRTPLEDYMSNSNCPLAKAAKRALNIPDILVGSITVGNGRINPPFFESDYKKLRNGEITEFITEYTQITQ